MQKGKCPTVNVLVVDPQGRIRLVQCTRITPLPSEPASGCADQPAA